MLYIDGLALSKLKDEFSNTLCGRKAAKISQYDQHSLSIFFGKGNLFISINPSCPIAYLSDAAHESPHAPMSFLLTLRKYIAGGLLKRVYQMGFDRIIVFNFEKLTELGELKEYNLILELMGKHSNLILADEKMKIIDLLKKFSLEENSIRILLAGSLYKMPILSIKKSPLDITEDFFRQEINTYQDIFSKIDGFGKHSALEICKNGAPDYSIFMDLIKKPAQPVVYLDSNSEIKVPSFGSVFHFDSFSNKDKLEFETISQMINYYIENTIKSQQISSMKASLLKLISNEIKKNERTIVILKREAEEDKDFEKYKKIGDIIAANLYLVKKNLNSIVLYDFYSEKEITISLNPDLHPQENLAAYYKKYNKYKTKAEYNIKRMNILQDENNYLESVFYSINSADNQDVIREIELELVENNYIRKKPAKEKKKASKLEFKKFISSEGFTILAGRNNKENDYITFKLASKNDYWFHAKNIPGSHIVIKTDTSENNLTEVTLSEAASIAALFSKGKADTTVVVDFTRRKYVVKPNGSKPGFVTYTNQKSLNVKPYLQDTEK